MQFEWKHILTAVEANFNLLENICICSMLWLWSRGGQKVPIAILLLYFIALTILGENVLWKGSLVTILSGGTLLSLI